MIMADLADKIDDLICTFDGGINTTIDTVAMYLFGVFVFALLVLVFTYHVYGKYRRPKTIKGTSTTTTNTVIGSGSGGINGKTSYSAANGGMETNRTVSGLSGAPGGNRSLPSTPPVRKRLGSKSGKMANISPSRPRSQCFPPPATGADAETVKWVNELLLWLYSDQVVVGELVAYWIQALNESMKTSVNEHGVGVELVKLLPETHPPSLNNIFCECASNDDIKITCDCEITPAMQLKAFRQRGDKVEVSHYRVNVNKFRSRLNVYCITEKLHIKVKLDGWPEIKILLAQVGSLKNNDLDEQSLQEVIIDIVTSALRSTNVDLNLNGYVGCPRFIRRPPTPSQHLPLHYDSMMTSSNSNLSKFGDKLVVKVIKATGLAVSDGTGNIEPFCIVEIDNPAQTYQSKVVRGTDSPSWNEQFLFNVNIRTKEILFEVYNRGVRENERNKFLGWAIVSLQELLESSSQRQVISLQPRPYQNDKVTGTLTLEFAFVDGGEAYVNGLTGTDHTVNYTAGLNRNQRTNGPSKNAYANPLDRDYLVNGMTEKSISDVESNNTNAIKQPASNVQQDGISSNVAASTYNHNQDSSYNDTQHIETDTIDNQQNGIDTNGRGRRRKRDFFGTIRKRLNRSRGRAKSTERNNYNGDVNNETSPTNSPPSRSVSADRTRDPSAHSVHSTVGPLPREGSTRSSLSEMSGVSGASSRTYLNDASTLVLETLENGIKKYYLVPLSLAQKNKWKKKGTKLHIYNEHTFVAKHLPGGTPCQICSRTLPRRLGKQGYECRDCQMKCHKQCHVRTDINCPSSTLQNLELSGSLKIPKLGATR